MTKRLIDVDDRLLQAAREALGVETYKETVNRALERVVAQQPSNADTASVLRAFADATVDLADPEVMTTAWQ
ncbi:MAG: type II toxin-antitoxin system VapB family antitoxin [Egibacteraceae bacterium]